MSSKIKIHEEAEHCPVCFNPLEGLPDFCSHCGTDLSTLTRYRPAKVSTSFFAEFTPGNVVLGRYSILEVIGRGGMGVIYKALDTLGSREVAIKTVNLDSSAYSDEDLVELRQRFTRETYASSQVSHPNIVSVLDVGSVEDEAYICMEFLEGQTLDTYLYMNGPMPWKQFVKVAIQLLDALHHIHSHDIIHRDIKPANIMIQHDGTPKLMDFGLAKIEITGVSAFTREGQIMGTAQYCSPEVVQGDNVDFRCDLFSFGAVFYEMITGINPFQAASVGAILEKVIHTPVKPPSTFIKNIPDWLDKVVMICLQKNPENRFYSAKEVKTVLENQGKGLRPELAKVLEEGSDVYESSPTLDMATPSTVLSSDSFYRLHQHDLDDLTDDPVARQVALEREMEELLRQARKYLRVEDWNRANAFYSQAIKLRLATPEAWFGKCFILLEQKKLNMFLDALNTAQSILPHDPEFHVLRALYLHRHSDKKRLVEHLKRFRLQPTGSVFYWLVKADLCDGDIVKMKQCFEKALEIEDNWYSNFRIGRILHSTKWYELASQSFQRALNQDRTKAVVFLHLGRCREQMGDFRAARQCYLAVIDMDSRNKEAKESLTRVEGIGLGTRLYRRLQYLFSRRIHFSSKW